MMRAFGFREIRKQIKAYPDATDYNQRAVDKAFRDGRITRQEQIELVRLLASEQVKRSPLPMNSVDAIAMKLGLGRIRPHETMTHVTVPEPLITSRVSGKHGRTWTLIVPPWNNSPKMDKRLVNHAVKSGKVTEIRWRREAISADVKTTAQSFHRMIDFVADTLRGIAADLNPYHPDSDKAHISIISCSAGIPITSGALRKLYDEGNRTLFDSIGLVVFVGMADDFADCYRYGARTKHMGEIAEANGWTIDRLRAEFRHMAPINAIPALNAAGRVYWITSSSDIYFPLRNQQAVMREIERTGSRIHAMDFPSLGHVGISAVYYVLAGGLLDTKSTKATMKELLRGASRPIIDRLMLPITFIRFANALGDSLPGGESR